MATVTGLTAEKMQEIEGASIVDGEIIDGNLILTKHDGTTIDAGNVEGPAGPVGPMGPGGGSIPGEVRLWSGDELPLLANYGKWVWADGAIYVVADHPLAADYIAPQWRTFGGASDPGASNFRVPDMRGLVPAGLDAMPGGARANRMTRAIAIVLAGKAGTETHLISVAEMPAHGHGINDPGHSHGSEASTGNVGAPYRMLNTQVTTEDAADRAANGQYILSNVTGVTIQNNGGGGAHENVQPTVFVPYIVKLD